MSDNTTADKAEIWFDAQLDSALEFVSILHGTQHAPISASGIIHVLGDFPEVFDHEAQAEAACQTVNTADEDLILSFGLEVLELFEAEFGQAPPPRTPNGENAHEAVAYFAAHHLRFIRQSAPEKYQHLASNVCILLALSFAAG